MVSYCRCERKAHFPAVSSVSPAQYGFSGARDPRRQLQRITAVGILSIVLSFRWSVKPRTMVASQHRCTDNIKFGFGIRGSPNPPKNPLISKLLVPRMVLSSCTRRNCFATSVNNSKGTYECHWNASNHTEETESNKISIQISCKNIFMLLHINIHKDWFNKSKGQH